MKIIIALGLALFLAAVVQPAFAQAPGAEEHWQQFLSNHPGLAEHPERLNNPQYMKEHPNMSKWLEQHPGVMAQSRHEGMWGHDGVWHDSDWWHENNRAYANQYHPEWAEHHPDWRRAGDGDWDDSHHWHARDWWVSNHRDWVAQHHANWLAHHGENGEHHG